MFHCATCNFSPRCPLVGCEQTKKLINHVTTCRSKTFGQGCLICSQVEALEKFKRNEVSFSVSGARRPRSVSDFSGMQRNNGSPPSQLGPMKMNHARDEKAMHTAGYVKTIEHAQVPFFV